MGTACIDPPAARRAIATALSQQEEAGDDAGRDPPGPPGAELKHTNQVPHADHRVWLPVALEAHLSETASWAHRSFVERACAACAATPAWLKSCSTARRFHRHAPRGSGLDSTTKSRC